MKFTDQQVQMAFQLLGIVEKLPSRLQEQVYDIVHEYLKPPSVIRTIEL